MKEPVFFFHTTPRPTLPPRFGDRRILAVSRVRPCYRVGVINPPGNPWATAMSELVRLACRRAFTLFSARGI
jgi:hypothetical protein